MRSIDWLRARPGTWAGSAILVLAIALGGCGTKGPELSPVKGKITQNGQPLAGAILMFMPEKGAPSGGKTDDQGQFELRHNDGRPGAVPGKHNVSISVPGPEAPPPMGGQAEPPPPAKPPVEFHKTVEIKSGPNDLTIEVAQ